MFTVAYAPSHTTSNQPNNTFCLPPKIALVLQEKAAFEDMKSHGVVSDDAFFAGHSLGEYAAVTSTCDLFSIEALVEIVFLRGMVMQNAVPRDANGRSSFGMVAASPMRVGAHFTLDVLNGVVDKIDAANELLQVVNFNVEGMQYVVAGDLSSLEMLSLAMGAATTEPAVLGDLDGLVARCKAEVSGCTPLCGLVFVLRNHERRG